MLVLGGLVPLADAGAEEEEDVNGVLCCGFTVPLARAFVSPFFIFIRFNGLIGSGGTSFGFLGLSSFFSANGATFSVCEFKSIMLGRGSDGGSFTVALFSCSWSTVTRTLEGG
jgi:hypothetical protein